MTPEERASALSAAAELFWQALGPLQGDDRGWLAATLAEMYQTIQDLKAKLEEE